MSNKTAYQVIFGNQTNGYYFSGQQLSATVNIENKVPKLIKGDCPGYITSKHNHLMGMIIENGANQSSHNKRLQTKLLMGKCDERTNGEIHATIRGRGRVKLIKSKIWEPDENYSLFSKTITLRKSENNDFVILPAGKHTYNINHQLPKEIPSSFSGKYGFVVYEVSLTLHENAYTLDSIFSQAFIVFNNNRIPIPKPPEQFQETTTICGCCCILQDQLKMNITPLSNNCTTGDIVKFEATFENESYEKVNEMRLKVYKNIEYIWPKDPSMKKEQKIIIEEKKEHAVDFSHDDLCIFSVKIPFTQPSMQNQWINISYTISVETFLPTCCDDEIRAQCPITIAIGHSGPEFHGTAAAVVTVQPTLAKNPILGGYQPPQLGYPTNNMVWTPQQNMTPYPSSTTTYPSSIQPVEVPGWNVSQTSVQQPYPMAPTNTVSYPTEVKSAVSYPIVATNIAPYPIAGPNVPTNINTHTSTNVHPISNPITYPSSTNVYNSPSKAAVITSPYPAPQPQSASTIGYTPQPGYPPEKSYTTHSDHKEPTFESSSNYKIPSESYQSSISTATVYPHQVSTGSSNQPYSSAMQSTAGESISSDIFKSQPGYPPAASYTTLSDHKEPTFESSSNYKIPSESYQSSISAPTVYPHQVSTGSSNQPYSSAMQSTAGESISSDLFKSQPGYPPAVSYTTHSDHKEPTFESSSNYKIPSESYQSSISAATVYPHKVSTGSSNQPYSSAMQSTAGESISSDLFKSQPGYPPAASYTTHSDHKEPTFESASNYKIPSESYQSSMSAAIASDAYLSQKSPLRTEPLKATSGASYKPTDSTAESTSQLNGTNYKTPSESFQSSIPSVIASDSYRSNQTSVPTDPYIANKDLSNNPINESSSLLNTKPTGYTFTSDTFSTDFYSYPSESNQQRSQENRDNLKIDINPDFSRSFSEEITPISPYDPVTPEFGETNIKDKTSSNAAAKSGRSKITSGRKKINERKKF